MTSLLRQTPVPRKIIQLKISSHKYDENDKMPSGQKKRMLLNWYQLVALFCMLNRGIVFHYTTVFLFFSVDEWLLFYSKHWHGLSSYWIGIVLLFRSKFRGTPRLNMIMDDFMLLMKNLTSTKVPVNTVMSL